MATNRMTMQEYKKQMKKSKKSKYGNKKVEIDGHVFDSKAESKYYLQVKWLYENKQILMYRLQPRYRLLDGFEKHGKKHRPIDYVADFEIHKLDGSIEVIDVKSKATLTSTFRIKEKLFNRKYPHELKLVQYKNGYFIEI